MLWKSSAQDPPSEARIGWAGSVHCWLDLAWHAPVCAAVPFLVPGSVRQTPDAGLTSSPSVPCAHCSRGLPLQLHNSVTRPE